VVFVDRSLLMTRLWGRLASRLGHSSYRVVDTNLARPIHSWLAAPQNIVRDPLLAGSRVGAVFAAAAIATVPTVATIVSSVSPASASAPRHSLNDPFAQGISVVPSRINGDGSSTGGDGSKTKPPGHGGTRVPRSAIGGDGTILIAPLATGSIALVDAHHLKYFINTNITFSTTSAASGAMSEASFTQAVVASTSAGGTTTSTLDDAFDNYNALFVDVGGTTTGHSDPNNMYNRTGASAALDNSPNPECAGQNVVFPTEEMQGLDVHREVYVPTDGSYARWLNVFTNSTSAAITAGVGTANNIGSDSNTIITGSSNGDTTADLTDTWVGTFQNFSGNTSSDPRAAHVIQGADAPVAPTAVNFTNGDDNPFWAWDITVQPGETVTMMNFVAEEGTKAAAAADASSLAALTPGENGITPELRCMSEASLSSLENFALPDVSVAPVTVGEGDGSAALVFTRTASGASATVTYSLTAGTATDGADYTDPSPLTVSFAAGATTATASIPIVDDTLVETDETFQAAITNVTGYGKITATPEDAAATITIKDNDVAPTTTTEAPTTTAAELPAVAPTMPATPVVLPATGGSPTPVAWLAGAFLAAGAVIVRVVRRRPARH
jgi:hypothetical protein